MDRACIYKDKAGEWRWKVIAPNEDIIGASSEGYEHMTDCRDNLIRNGHGDLIGDTDPTEPVDE
jgi:uncharacterized protein YegP (UPF0339 family)